MDRVGQAPAYSQLGLFLPETSDRTLVPVLGNYLSVIIFFSVLHGIAWAASGVVVLTWEFHHVRAFPCRVHVANLTWHATVQLLML
ncbi:hypothetical protein Tco_0472853 [Tanacetum coccineum]